MADSNQDKGFALPAPQSSTTAGTPTVAEGKLTAQGQLNVVQADVAEQQGPQPRDYAISGAILAVLLVVFFLVRKAYADHLARKRVPFSSANAAGWWLFIFLSSLAIASVLAFISPAKFLTPLFMAPLGVLGLVAIVLTFVTGRRA
jgi:hypothetical protein